MKCPRCNREINEDNQYCPYCGQRIVRSEEEIMMKEIRDFRMKQFTIIMNRVLNIATIIAVVFAIIGLFGPVISVPTVNGDMQIGGLGWFTYEGWTMLNDGIITVGPFYLTFVLYILMLVGVIGVSVHALFKSINALRKHEECHTAPHIIFLSLIHHVYSAFLYCFYYEYEETVNGYYEVGADWGSTVYGVAIPLFTIGLIAYLIMKSVINGDKKKIVKTVFALVSSFAVLNFIEVVFAVLGFQDLHIDEQDAFGTLHYFDLVGDMPGNVAALIIMMFIFGLLYIGVAITLGITTIRNLVKYDKIDRKLFLSLAISSAVITFTMLILNSIFGFSCNDIPGFENNVLFANSNLLLMLFASMSALGLGIAIFAMGEDKKVDSNIIDAEVIDKDA